MTLISISSIFAALIASAASKSSPYVISHTQNNSARVTPTQLDNISTPRIIHNMGGFQKFATS